MQQSSMSYTFLFLLGIIKLACGELTCNGVQVSNQAASQIFVAGVCESSVVESEDPNLPAYAESVIESSTKFECRAGEMYEISYPKRDCIADGTESESKVETNDFLGITVACDLGYCEYIKIRQYDHIFNPSDPCDEYTPDHMETFVEGIYVNNDKCIPLAASSLLVTCDGTVATQKFYGDLIEDCTGDPTTSVEFTTLSTAKCETVTITSILLGVSTQEVYYSVDCGTAGSNNGSNNGGSDQTTDAPSTGTTDKDNTPTNSNHVNMVQYNHLLHCLCIIYVIYFLC
eukprot:231341_1